MRRAHALLNIAHDELQVWVEPWADLYVVRRGAKVVFRYAVEGATDLLESEVADGRMTFWFSGPDAPTVTVNGVEAEPVDQSDWQARTRERPSLVPLSTHCRR